MTEAARIRLCEGFDVDASKVTTIAHGAAIPQLTRCAGERSTGHFDLGAHWTG